MKKQLKFKTSARFDPGMPLGSFIHWKRKNNDNKLIFCSKNNIDFKQLSMDLYVNDFVSTKINS